MIKRRCEEYIKNWIQNGKTALLVTGARQIGKTFLIENLLAETEKEFVKFNLIEQPEIVDLISERRNAKDLAMKLSAAAGKELPNGSFIFLDEIQKCKEIVTKIKFLVDEGSYRYVLSGSLLGVELEGLESAPVGYMSILRMFPIDFYEFSMACGQSEETLNYLKNCFENQREVDSFIHNVFTDLFYKYLVIGGMPQAVQTYLDTNNLQSVRDVLTQIRNMYYLDFTQYAERTEKLKIREIYDRIPSELNKQNKRFIFTHMNKELKFDRWENSFLWLKDAGAAIPVYSVNDCRLPLEQSRASNLFKLFINDTGMLNSFYSAQVTLKILTKDGTVNNGALFENVAAQQLEANELVPYFYKTKNYGEVDFMVELDDEIIPIEIKSGKNFKTHAALNNLLTLENPDLEKTYVFADTNLFCEGKIIYCPIYLLMFLKKKTLTDLMG